MKHDSFFHFHSTFSFFLQFLCARFINDLTFFNIYYEKIPLSMKGFQDVGPWGYIQNKDNYVSFMAENQRKSGKVLFLYVPIHNHSPGSINRAQWYFGKITKCIIPSSMHYTTRQRDNVQRREPGLSHVAKQHQNLS